MPLIKVTSALGANATVFPLQGGQYEFLPFDAMVEFAILADAGDVILGTVFSGSDVLMQSAQLDTLAVATPITYPDDYNLSDVAGAGERISVELVENAGAASTCRTAVRITPL